MREEIGMRKEFDCHDYMSETTVDILLRKFKFLIAVLQFTLFQTTETVMGSTKERSPHASFKYAKAVME